MPNLQVTRCVSPGRAEGAFGDLALLAVRPEPAFLVEVHRTAAIRTTEGEGTAMTVIAIVGSRDFPDLDRVRRFVRSLRPDVVVVSGGAGGVDSAAICEARARGLAVEVFTPDWTHFGRAAGAIRNRQIVERADRVVAFWDGVSKGTKITIDLAQLARKPVEIIRP
jgi:hypothetical protein